MGVDAKMFAITEQKLSETDLKLASGQLVSIVGKNAFFLDKEGKWGEPQHALSLGNFDEATFEHIGVNCGTLIKVNLMGRYYGSDYERGPWTDFRIIAEWLEVNLNAAAAIRFLMRFVWSRCLFLLRKLVEYCIVRLRVGEGNK